MWRRILKKKKSVYRNLKLYFPFTDQSMSVNVFSICVFITQNGHFISRPGR